jgi:VWFA-related protein
MIIGGQEFLMRVPALCAALLVATVAVHSQQAPSQTQPPPQPQQPPVFRAGVDLLTVDATVVDNEGRQIVDLKASEFTVEVDGAPRPVVTAEYVRLADDRPIVVGPRKPDPPQVDPNEAFFSTNTRAAAPGRLILLVVDQGNIRVGQGRQVMRSAVKFVDRLDPNDRVAVVGIPGPGVLVDFTTEHEKVREGLLSIAGSATKFLGRFHISLTEALATVNHSDPVLTQALINRECAGTLNNPALAIQCELEVEQECSEIVTQQRAQTQSSLNSIRSILKGLGAAEGPKSVIFISEGLVLENLTADVDDIAAMAADVRATVDVMLLDVPDVDVSEAQRPTTPREDRELQTSGLESLAGVTRGALYRVISGGDTAFTRVLRSISGYYLLAVEAGPKDRDGRRHRINVKVSRRGATLYSRRGFLAPTSPAATTPADAVGKALRAALTMNDIPMRLATWTYKDPGTTRVRVLVTAEIARTPTQALDYTAGFMIIDRDRKGVATPIEQKKLAVSDADPGVAVFSAAIPLDPGRYLLRFAAADSEGRLGSIERRLDAFQMDAPGLALGDLMVSQAPDDRTIRVVPAIEPQVGNGRLAAMVEVYGSTPQTLQGVQATLDVLPGENEKPITSTPMQISPGVSSEIGSVQAMVNTAALPPGRYFARATITQGGKPQGHFTRPFRVIPGGAVATAAVAGAHTPTALPPQLAEAILSDFPHVDRKTLLTPAVITAVLANAENSRPGAAAKSAIATARGGKFGPAALDALAAGDQVLASFLRGIDFFSQGQVDRASAQFNLAMQGAPNFAAVRMYLGAILSIANKHRDAASLLSSVPDDVAGPAPVARLAAISWLHAGDVGLAIESLEKAVKAKDADATRALALAYVVGNRPNDALPLLEEHLKAQPKDQAALIAAIYATYARYAGDAPPSTLAADRARAQAWAKAYAAGGGTMQNLTQAWMKYLEGLK